MIEKTTVLVICIHKRVKPIVFAVSTKLCNELGLAILNKLESPLPKDALFSPDENVKSV